MRRKPNATDAPTGPSAPLVDALAPTRNLLISAARLLVALLVTVAVSRWPWLWCFSPLVVLFTIEVWRWLDRREKLRHDAEAAWRTIAAQMDDLAGDLEQRVRAVTRDAMIRGITRAIEDHERRR